uniref:Ferric leghemoglobin reductase, putative n=4 Tax=Oryza TaxID=4527 RepID=Q10FN0_ORYSJ|nr:ferric leghemoglobin reductase, putative [Oryza sativa Japonica Group]
MCLLKKNKVEYARGFWKFLYPSEVPVDLHEIPKKLVIVGAGYIGLETVLSGTGQVASFGKIEEQVKASGVAYQVGKSSLLAHRCSKAIDDAEELVKVMAEKQ